MCNAIKTWRDGHLEQHKNFAPPYGSHLATFDGLPGNLELILERCVFVTVVATSDGGFIRN